MLYRVTLAYDYGCVELQRVLHVVSADSDEAAEIRADQVRAEQQRLLPNGHTLQIHKIEEIN